MIITDIFGINSRDPFEDIALKVFKFQFENSIVYRSFCQHLKKSPETVNQISQIPYLPIEFFKKKEVISEGKKPQIIFESSGTTGTITSKHLVSDVSLYEKSFTKGFQLRYGAIKNYCILALLPSYLEKGNSSLIYMVKTLIEKSEHADSGFYLQKGGELRNVLSELQKANSQTLLIGVSYALLDLIEESSIPLKNTIIMETGGMKGRRKEMVREELHKKLMEGFNQTEIHSEYGMTELLSQAYSNGNGIFKCPPWMGIAIRDAEDPLSLVKTGENGGINVIDLANINSCSFIATQDLGRVYKDNSFEVLGRFDHSDIRGCNLLAL